MQMVRAPRGLDQAGMAWAKLLADPCGAKLCAPCYGGTGSGYLVRTKTAIVPPGNATDFVAIIAPNQNVNAMAYWGYSSSPGGSLGTYTTFPHPTFVTSGNVVSFRAIAQCVRVVYTGTLLNNAGRAGFYSCPNGVDYGNGTSFTNVALGYMIKAQRSCHMSDEHKEIRWVPNTVDQQFLNETSGTLSRTGGGTIVSVVGATPGTFYLEFYTVYEWCPDTGSATGNLSGLVETSHITPSRNTFNEVLQYLEGAAGGLINFATSPSISTVLRIGYQAAKGLYSGRGSMLTM